VTSIKVRYALQLKLKERSKRVSNESKRRHLYQANSDQPLLLISGDTTLSPIIGVLKEALESRHVAPIEIVLVSSNKSEQYRVKVLQDLVSEHVNVKLHFVSPKREKIAMEDIYKIVGSKFPILNKHQIYLSGSTDFISNMRTVCFINGASMRHIYFYSEINDYDYLLNAEC